MAARTQLYIKFPWTGGLSSVVDKGITSDNDLIQADNLVFNTANTRTKRGGLDDFGSKIPTVTFRASSGTTRTITFATDIVETIPTNRIFVLGEKITIDGPDSGTEALYAVIDATITAITTTTISYTAVGSLTEGSTAASEIVANRAASILSLNDYWRFNDLFVKDQLLMAATDEFKLFKYRTDGNRDEVASSSVAEVFTVKTFADVNNDLINTYFVMDGVGTNTDFYVWYNMPTSEITRVETVADSSGSLNDTYFFLNNPSGDTQYYVWYDVSGGGTDPSIGGRTGIEVDISTNDSAGDVAIATQAAIDAETDFTASIVNTQVDITHVNTGDTVDASDDGATGFSLSVLTQGLDLGGVDPAPIGRTGVQVDIDTNDTADDIATATQVEIDGLTDFSATVDTDTVTVTYADGGNVTNATDEGLTEFTIVTTLEGQDDAEPTEDIRTINTLTMNNTAVFAFDQRGNRPIKYRPEDSDDYALLEGFPADFSIMTEWLGRMWTNDKSEPDRLHYSATGNIEQWNGTSDSGAIDISFGDGDSKGITAIYPFKGILFIAKGARMFRITGGAPETFKVEPVSDGIGVESAASVTAIDQGDVYFASRRGFHSTQSTASFGDTSTTFLSSKIQQSFNQIDKTVLDKVQGTYVPNLNSVAFGVSTNDTTNNQVLLLHVPSNEWYSWPNVSCEALTTRIVENEKLLVTGTADGRVLQYDATSFRDFDTDPIPYRLKTPAIYPDGNPQSMKSFKRVGFLYKPIGQFEFTVNVKIDNFPTQSLTFTQPIGGDVLDVDFILGSSILGNQDVLAPFMFTIDGRGRGITLTVTQNSLDEQVEIYGFLVEFETLGLVQEVV